MRVVIAGGGVAALEAALALRELAEERVDVDLLAPEPVYWYRPLAVAEPFGLGTVQAVEVADVAAAAGAQFSLAALGAVDVELRCAWSADGARFDYDALVVACGTRSEPVVPGALTFRGPADTEWFRRVLEELDEGTVRRLVFAAPGGPVWPLPLYELALLTAAYLKARDVDAELVLVTPEEGPLHVFGYEASAALRQLLDERGIEFRGGSFPLAFEEGELATAVGGRLAADRVIALPRLRGVAIEGLPHDRDGFLAVDRHGRVLGAPGVYAAGDITSFSVKQGGLASQQADAVAEAIAASAGAPIRPRPFQPILRGLLLTGGIPAYLRAPLLAEGAGDARVAVEPLWWPPAKIAARRLSPFLASLAMHPSVANAIPVELEVGGPSGGSVDPTDADGPAAAER
jgi:sulfide:quinone oxidoreductase